MTAATPLSTRIHTIQQAITETEWEWRQLDQQEWRSGTAEGRVLYARAKRELEDEAGRLRAELAAAIAGDGVSRVG